MTRAHPDQAPERPGAVPLTAWWSPKDNEWVLGDEDADGELHGVVRYWRPDGTLCCICQLRHGKPHGPYQRFHETGEVSQTGRHEAGKIHGLRNCFAASGPTTENMHAGGLSLEVVRSEYDYVHGELVSTRYFGADGTALGRDGSPLPRRPGGVPPNAIHNPNSGNWLVGVWDGEGRRDGPLEVFSGAGERVAIETYRKDVAHGPTTLFYPEGGKWAVLEYADGALSGVTEHYYRNGGLARRAHFRDNEWAGTLSDWSPSGELTAEVDLGPPAPARPTQAPSESQLRGEIDAQGLTEVAGPISGPGVARLMAIGWGGDDERDATMARAARRVVRGIEDPQLSAALAATGLDTAPRLLTATRVERVVVAMRSVAAVDDDALVTGLAERGGVGASAALYRQDAAGVAILRQRVANQRLDLRWLGLDQLPRTVSHLPWLREIDASNNRIDTLPPTISEVMFLRKLSLGSNRLATLPSELERLRELVSLMLASNRLSSLPGVISELTSLTSLSLGDNQLEALPDSFGQLGRLRTLWLHGNPLAELSPSFARLSSLSFLHLGDIPWATPPAVIYELESLRELWIASPSLTHLPADIARLTKLERLIIWHSRLTELPKVLFEMRSLRELRVSHNPLPEGTIDRLKEALPDCTIY